MSNKLSEKGQEGARDKGQGAREKGQGTRGKGQGTKRGKGKGVFGLKLRGWGVGWGRLFF